MTTSKIQNHSTTVEALLWTHSVNKDKLHPVKIRITHNRKPKYYPMTDADGQKMFLSESQWKAAMGERPRGANKTARERIDAVTLMARNAVNKTCEVHEFTFEAFERNFLHGGARKTFYTIFEEHLQILKKEGRIGTMVSYSNALSALKRFCKDFMPVDLTPEKLKDFELWMRGQDLSVTTIGIYTRSIRVIYNVCIEHDPSLRELYPFSRGRQERSKYKIKSGHGSKGDALTFKQLQAFNKIKTKPGTPAP